VLTLCVYGTDCDSLNLNVRDSHKRQYTSSIVFITVTILSCVQYEGEFYKCGYDRVAQAIVYFEFYNRFILEAHLEQALVPVEDTNVG